MHILSGEDTRFVGDHIGKYQAGDICLIGSQLPHEWRSSEEHLQANCLIPPACQCLYFPKDLFEKNLIHLPEMRNIRLLLERSQRGIRFFGELALKPDSTTYLISSNYSSVPPNYRHPNTKRPSG